MNGIVIGIDPIILHLGSLSVSWHSLLMVIGIIAGVWLSTRLVKRAGLSADTLFNIALWGVPGGLIGSRIIHVIDYWDFYAANPGNILAIWNGGMALWGGILGGILGVMIYARIRGVKISDYADLIAPGLILGQAIGRIGDIINGEHFSKIAGPPWGVVYSHPNSPAAGNPPAHLAVGYEMILDLIIMGVLLKLIGKIQPKGTVFLIYLISFSFGRFFLSFLRLDSNTVLLGINQQQWISLIVLIPAVVMLVIRRRRWSASQAG